MIHKNYIYHYIVLAPTSTWNIKQLNQSEHNALSLNLNIRAIRISGMGKNVSLQCRAANTLLTTTQMQG